MSAHHYWYQTSECIVLCCTGMAILLDYVIPFPLTRSLWSAVAGGALISVSVALLAWCHLLFGRSGESTKPGRPTQSLITVGPYRWSRNPIYVAAVAIVFGVGLLTGSIWIGIAACVAGVLIWQLLVLPEEAYLEARFGDDYLIYKRQVRRWL